MELSERIARYEAIEEHRKRPVIVYATTTRRNVGGQMAADAIREFIDQIDAIGPDGEVDILIHSTGGDALTAWKLMSLLRERFDNVAVLVPFVGFSAATIFALGADEIVMHPHASLGPIDPQIRVKQPDGKVRSFGYEDLGSFLKFLSEDAKFENAAEASAVVERIFATVDPLVVGGAKRASALAADMGVRLLSMHMERESEEGKGKIKAIAENLNKKFFSHGDAISRKRARELDLKIAASDPDLESLLWNAHLGIERYLELRRPFNPLELFMSHPEATEAIGPIGPLVLPENAPAEVVQKTWQFAANEAIQRSRKPGLEVDYSVVNAVVESPRKASEFRTSGRITARRVDTQVEVTASETDSGWREVPVPQ